MADAKTPAGAKPVGHNSGAAPQIDDRDALLIYHMAKLRPQTKMLAEAKVKAAAEAQSLTELFNYATADLKVSRKFLQGLLDAAGTSHRDLLDERKQLDWAFSVMGLPIQTDLFGAGETPETAKDGLAWRYQGYMDGMAGKFAEPPDGMHSMFLQDYQQGFEDATAVNALGLARAAALKQAEQTPSAAPAVDLNSSEEEDEEDKIADAAAKLKRDPEFMARGGPDDIPEDDEGEVGGEDEATASAAVH